MLISSSVRVLFDGLDSKVIYESRMLPDSPNVLNRVHIWDDNSTQLQRWLGRHDSQQRESLPLATPVGILTMIVRCFPTISSTTRISDCHGWTGTSQRDGPLILMAV